MIDNQNIENTYPSPYQWTGPNQNGNEVPSYDMMSPSGQDQGIDVSSPSEYRHYEAGAGDRRLNISPKLTMPYKSVNEVWSIYGKRGSGKSYFLGKLCEELNRVGVPFLIVDVKDAHEFIELPGVKHTHMTKIQPTALINLLGAGQSVILSMKGLGIDDMRSYVSELCESLNRCRFGKRFNHPVMVALEECHNFTGQSSGSAGGDSKIRSQCLSSVDKLIREGRADGVGAILISQSVATVLANVRRQCEIKVMFNIKDHTDIANLEKELIGKTKQDVREIIDKIYHFEVGQFACISTLYIRDPGIIIDKTAERTTRHAGRSFIEGDSGSMLPSSDYDILGVPLEVEPDIPDNGSADVGVEPDAELYSAGPVATNGKKLIDYKNALLIGLGVMSMLGIAMVVFKKYMEHKSLENENIMEQRLREEQRKVMALQPEPKQEAQQQVTNDTGGGMLAQFLNTASMPPDVKAELDYDPTYSSFPFGQ